MRLIKFISSKLTTVQQIKTSFYLLNFPSLAREGVGGELKNRYLSSYFLSKYANR